MQYESRLKQIIAETEKANGQKEFEFSSQAIKGVKVPDKIGADKIVGYIYQTADFGKFGFLGYNRDTSENTISELIPSLTRRNRTNVQPICVDKDFNVVDGQNRLKACEQLGQEICYTVDMNFKPEDLGSFNGDRTNWGTKQFLHYYLMLGNINYKLFDAMLKELHWNIAQLIAWIGHTVFLEGVSRGSHVVFCKGLFVFKAPDDILKAIDTTKDIIEILKEHKVEPSRIKDDVKFHFALKGFLRSEHIDHAELLHKIKCNPHALKLMATMKEYIQLLVGIYNYKRLRGKIGIIDKKGVIEYYTE